MKKKILSLIMAAGIIINFIPSDVSAIDPVTKPIDSTTTKTIDLTSSKQDAGNWGLTKKEASATSLNKVFNVFYFFAGVIAVILIIYAGFMYVTSAGDAGKVTKAKNIIAASIIGIIIIILAYAITAFVAGRI